jgi:hypothetical protein
MMRRLGFFLVLLALLAPAASSLQAVGTVTLTCPERNGSVQRCVFTWLADGSGNVNTNPLDFPYGEIIRMDTDPDGGALAPDDNYDVTLLDTAGVDVLQGQGANRDTANVESVVFAVPIWHSRSRKLDLNIAAAGNANSGVLTVWVRQ